MKNLEPSPGDLRALVGVAESVLARRSLLDFGFRMYHGFEAPQHVVRMAQLLEDVEAGRLRRLMVNIPPRHAKSVSCSSLFPAYYLGRNPSKNVIIATHSAELSERNSRLARSFLESDRWPFDEVKLAGDSSAVNRWNVTAGGGLYAIGTGGAITGRGADVLILDDITHDEGSEAEREAAYRWFAEVAVPRLEPGGAIVAIGTRFSETDIFGRIIEADKRRLWHIVTLPALAEAEDPLGRAPGAALWPGRVSVEELNERREAMGPRAFEAQFQQNPLSAAGNLIRREWLATRYTSVPDGLRITMSLDAASKTGISNDNSALVVIGSDKAQHFVLDVLARKVEYPDLRRLVLSMYEKHHPSKIFIEDTSSGTSLIQDLKRETRLPVIAVKVGSASKISRVEGITGLLESGRVSLPDERLNCAWLTDFERELLAFPNAKNDDRVDALALLLAQITKRRAGGAVLVCGGDDPESRLSEAALRLPPEQRAYPAAQFGGWPSGLR